VLAAVLAGQDAWQPADLNRVTMLDTRPQGMAALYDAESVVARYVAAMMRYRMVFEREDFSQLAYPFIFQDHPYSGMPWTWTASDGATVRRLPNGAFRITSSTYLGNLFTEVTCEDAGWPMFACSDGRKRQMSAPDLSTIIFDGTKYVRVLPAPR
jgi:hypothetical protein